LAANLNLRLQSLAGILEDPAKTQGFVALLREASYSEPGV
jgi:hypothetical protein